MSPGLALKQNNTKKFGNVVCTQKLPSSLESLWVLLGYVGLFEITELFFA